MTTSHSPYVLVHGAWHGGWCWSRVAQRLRAAGHPVYTPTLTGLGERSHLLSSAIDLDTFVADIGNVLIWEDLHDVVLVGHSFGGLVVSGVADKMPERIRQIVLLDAFLLPQDTSAFGTLSAEIVEKLTRSAANTNGISAPRPTSLGLQAPEDIAFVQGRLTPHPIGTYRQPFHLDHPLGNGLPVTYLSCTQPYFGAVAATQDWARRTYGDQWNWADLPCGHDAMVAEPDLVARTLMSIGQAAAGGPAPDQSAR
jgi:pimeloyl-ACP methyl ester carboxylesterase